MKYTPYIIILTLILIIIFQNQCQHPNPDKQPTQDTITITKTTFDTITIHDTIYKPNYIFKDTGTTIVIIKDTQILIRDYFTKYYYSDTLLNDSTGLIVINDTIFKNRIAFRLPKIKLFHPVITNTVTLNNTIQKSKLRLSAGFIVGGNLNSFSFGGSLLLTTRKKTSYALTYDLFNKQVTFGLYWQIF